MAYEDGTILSQYANINNVGTLWAQIVANFVHAAPRAKGDMLYWGEQSNVSGANNPKQPSRLAIGNTGDFLSVNNGVPVWTAFGTPSLAFSDTTTDAPELAITIQGKTSTAVALPVADATHSGIITTGAQTIAGAKTFKETVHSEKDVEADGGVSAYGIADLSMNGGGGQGTVIGITYGNVTLQTTYTPVDGIVTLPKSADNITWTSTNQSLTQTQKTNLLALYDRAPSALWNSGNEIADKSFVNSSIATATATFRGTVTATDDTDAAAATALATISTKDDNDYAFVKVENTPQTGVDKFKRYKYNGSAWVYEYTLNNSSFTSDQWNAINSGITTSLVTDIGTLKSFFNMSAGKALKAVEADKFSSARTIALTGNVTGSASSTGESGWSIATTIANGAVTNDMLAGSIANAKLVNSKVTIAGTDVSLGGSITAAQLQTNLGLGGAAYKAADYYVNSISWDSTNKKLAWSKGGTAQNAITIGYATDADTVDGHHASEFVGALGVSGDYLTWTRIGGTAQNITIPYATNANHALSSDKLATARTIWGQSFDGTANVSGAMEDVTNIDSLIYISSSKVGIGVSSPTVKLDIAGGIKTTEDISGGQDIYAAGGMAAYGIADLAMGGGGGTGTVIAIKFEGSSTQYNPVDGIITLPAYPSLIGYATQNWVSSQITALNLGTASTHDHGDYVTAVSISGTNLSVTKGSGSAVTSAINAATLEGTAKSGLFTALTTGTTNAVSMTIGGTTKNITASDLRTSLNIGQHSDYVTALGVSGNTLTWSKGGVAQTAITIPYATNAGQLGGVALGGLFTVFANDNKQLSATIGGVNKKLTLDYAKEATSLETESLTNQEFIFRNSPKTIGADSIKLDRILGRTVVWNQQLLTGNSTYSQFRAMYGTMTVSNGIVNYTLTNPHMSARIECSWTNFIRGHKYFLSAYINPPRNTTASFYVTSYTPNVSCPANTWTRVDGITTIGDGTIECGVYNNKLTQLSANDVVQYKQIFVIDLTLMFGAGNEPSTVAEFEALYPKAYYDYNAGQLINNSAEGLETVGFNIWDEEWEVGYINSTTGQNANISTTFRSKNYIPIIGELSYYVKQSYDSIYIYQYDANKNYIRYSQRNGSGLISIGSDARYIRFYFEPNGTQTLSYHNDICINLSDPAKNGTYEPYKRNVLDLHLDNIRVKSPNIWDEEWENCYWDEGNQGQKTYQNNSFGSKDYIKVLPNTNYYFRVSTNTSFYIVYYDENKEYLSYTAPAQNRGFTTPNNCHYVTFYSYMSYGTTYLNDICINESGWANGKYFPHGVLTFNGLKQAGNVRDEIVGGKYIRRVGSVDWGTLSWTNYKSGGFNTIIEDCKDYGNDVPASLLVADRYNVRPSSTSLSDGQMSFSYNHDKTLYVTDANYSSNTNQFKEDKSGVWMNYELATYETYELVDPIPTAMPAGTTERRLPEDTSDSVLAPFACDMTYGTNPGDILTDVVHLASRLDGMGITHYSSLSDSTKDAHVITIGGKKLYLKFRATQADATTNPQTLPAFELAVADNAEGENEQVFSFGTITEDWITTHCVLPS